MSASHRIPNALVSSRASQSLCCWRTCRAVPSLRSLVGIAVGMGITLPLYWLRAMGAGDVKLMGMVGAFLGGADTFAATLVIFVVGGVLGLVAVARRRAFRQLGANLKQMAFGGLVNT